MSPFFQTPSGSRRVPGAWGARGAGGPCMRMYVRAYVRIFCVMYFLCSWFYVVVLIILWASPLNFCPMKGKQRPPKLEPPPERGSMKSWWSLLP